MSYPPRPAARPRWPRPADVIRELTGLLRAHGVTGLYGSWCVLYGVLSLPGGLTVWFGLGGAQLRWRTGQAMVTWPAADTEGAAEYLAAKLRGPAEPGPGHPRAGRPGEPEAGR